MVTGITQSIVVLILLTHVRGGREGRLKPETASLAGEAGHGLL
jgi:hypothetical protein